MLMRAFAFCGRDRRILALLGSCYTCLVLIDIWVFCTKVDVLPQQLYVILDGTGCFPNYGAGFMALRIGVSAKLFNVFIRALVSIEVLVPTVFDGNLLSGTPGVGEGR